MFATPHTLHRAHVEAAAAAGVHAFVEKPFTLTTEDGRATIAAQHAAPPVDLEPLSAARSPAVDFADGGLALSLGMVRFSEVPWPQRRADT